MCIQELSLELPPHSPMLVENANVWGVSMSWFYVKRQSIVIHCKNIKLIFMMHPPLINMDLQEGMIIKGI